MSDRPNLQAPEPVLQVHLLGQQVLLYGADRLHLPATRKAQVLLAYLILHRKRAQPREHLAELFWGNRPEEKARNSLSTAIWHISRSLPAKGYILCDGQWVHFNPQQSVWLDVEQFEAGVAQSAIPQLQSALELYHGEFLEGSYEDWIIRERLRLESLYLDGLARLMHRNEDAGDYSATLAAAQRLLLHDPLREDAYQAVMRVYARLGLRNAALDQYQRCREIVRQELGAEPMLETSHLYQAILEGHFIPPGTMSEIPLGSAVTPKLSPVHHTGQNPVDSHLSAPFLGREYELEMLEGFWQRTKASQCELVLIKGEAGVGKTRLAEEFTNRLAWSGAQVLWGRCYEFERILPYQPLTEAIRSSQAALSVFRSVSVGSWMTIELASLVPELAAVRQDLNQSEDVGWLAETPGFTEVAEAAETQKVSQDQARLFEAIAWLLWEVAAAKGLVIVLEDLHWAAESTLELLHYLLRRLASSPILFIGTIRIEGLAECQTLRAFIESLKRGGMLQEMQLGRLTLEMVEALVFAMSGSDQAAKPLAQRLYQETEGNPFFIMEVIKALFESRSLSLEGGNWRGDFEQISSGLLPLPVDLAEAIRVRVQRLDPGVQEALSLAVVIGREFDYDLLRDAWGQSDEQILEVLDTLLRRRFVDEGSGPVGKDYAFTHHKIQEVIYADLPRRKRGQAHARIGAIIEKARATCLDEYAGELAFHYCQACKAGAAVTTTGYTDKAIYYLLRAGDQARLMYANKEACSHYLQALELLKGQGDYERMARVNMKLGVTYHNAFQYDPAHRAFETGFRLWQKMSEPGCLDLRPAPHALRTNWLAITSIDPAFGIDLAGVVAVQLFSGLVTFSVDLEIVPDAAKRWEVSPGGREYVFHLKDNLRWSDGKPLTAQDFEFSGLRILDPATKSPLANLLYDIQGSKAFNHGQSPDTAYVGLHALDPVTLLMQLEEPASYFIQLLANFLAVPQHCLEVYHDDWTDAPHIATSGPFRLENWEKGERMNLKKNPFYHSRFTGNLEQVALDLRPDPSAHLEMYAQNEIDVLEMKSYPVAAYKTALGKYPGEYFSFPASFVYLVGFDVRRPPFDDARVRRAFALAIDREMLASGVQMGWAFPATGGFVPPGLPGHSPAIALPYDPRLARELLEQSGFPQGRDFPQIQALTLFQPGDPLNAFLAEQWKEALGVEVHWDTVSPGLHLVLEKSPPNLFVSQWWGDYPDPDNFLGASQIRRWTGWRDEAFLELLDQSRLITNQSARLKLFAQADRLLVQSAAIVPLTYNRQHFLLKPWVKRYPTSPLFSWFWKDVVIEPH